MRHFIAPAAGLVLGGLLCAFAPVAGPSTPSNFTVQPDAARNTVTLHWNSSAPKIRFAFQKLLPNGTWEPLSGFPVTHDNHGSFFYDTPTTAVGTFRFRIRALDNGSYSEWTAWVQRTNLH